MTPKPADWTRGEIGIGLQWIVFHGAKLYLVIADAQNAAVAVHGIAPATASPIPQWLTLALRRVSDLVSVAVAIAGNCNGNREL